MLLLLLMKKITPIDPLKMKKFYKQQADRPLLWDEQTNKEASNSRIEDLVQREETVWSSCRSSCDISNQWIPRNANNSNNTSAQLPIQNNATKRDAIHRHAIWKRRRRSPNLFEKLNGNCDDDDDDGGFFNSSFPFLPLRTPPTPPPNPHLYRRFSNSHQSQPLMPQSSSIMLLLCILPEKRDIIFYLANFSKVFKDFLNKKSSENVFLSVPGCFFFYLFFIIFIF